MNNADKPEYKRDQEFKIDVLRTIERHGRKILTVAAAAAAAALVIALVMYVREPTSRTATLEFRPTFEGAAAGKYPNDLPFATSDITASSVLDAVYDTNAIQQFCPRDLFKGGFFVEQHSAEYAFLEAEFQQRLGDLRLTSVERERLQAEYLARRKSIAPQYRLLFVANGPCQEIPKAIVAKVLPEVLTVWAEQSELRRGVLKLRVAVLGPGALDVSFGSGGSILVRADLVRSALRRLIDNVRAVEALPGADLVRVGESRISLAEIRAKLEDLIQARLEPLVVLAGRGLGAESRAWVGEALASAVQDRDVAEGRVQAYREALRVYSGTPAAGAAPDQRSADTPQSDVRTQVDGSFIDRVLQMSEANVEFRQKLTTSMVEADVAAAQSRARVAYYQHLSNALQGAPGSMDAAALQQELQAIVADGKAMVTRFNQLYDEWSAVSFRPAAGMFRIDASVRDETVHAGRLLMLPVSAGSVLLLALAAGLVFFLARDHYADRRSRGRAANRP